jgi:choline kinase
MKAIILAAGRGSRMNQLTQDHPKCMVKFKNRPLLDWQVSALQKAGIEDIAVVTGYKSEKIIHAGVANFFHNPQWQNTNMIFSLFCAKEWLQDGFVISYSDIFYEAKIVAELLKSDAEIAITYDKNFAQLWNKRSENPLSDLETFKMDENNFLLEIGQKPKNISEIEGQFMGLLKFTKSGWKRAQDILQKHDITKLDCTSALQILISNGVKIKAVGISEMWGEVDNAGDLELYEKIY